ncbi:metallophosphoesterase [Candidatus Uhrbacteria bacterium]|nr:metallophosphoesterase [Candidatus Uhrbacteria bacterium]
MFPTLFYDLIIALVAASIPLFFVELARRRPRVADKKRYGIVSVLLTAVWLIVVYGSFVEPKILTVKTYPIALGATGTRLRIAVISDLHLGAYRHADWTAKIVKRINALRPDAVVLAGDFVATEAGTAGFAPLRDLETRFGAYAVLGNWDYRIGAIEVRKAIESASVEVLTNESVPLNVDGKTVRLVGLDDLTFGMPDWPAALASVQPGDVVIAAAHNPDAVQRAEHENVDLVVSGHTHCGQVRLPFIGPVPKLPTDLGRRYDCGVFGFGPVKLFITPGVGETGARARLFNPPEISLLDLTL